MLPRLRNAPGQHLSCKAPASTTHLGKLPEAIDTFKELIDLFERFAGCLWAQDVDEKKSGRCEATVKPQGARGSEAGI